MNRVTMTGRLGRDPELRKTNAGKSVANASIAVYAGKDQNGEIMTEWYDWTIWGDQAERFAKKARKGDTVWFDGREVRKKRQKDGVEYETSEHIVNDFLIQKKEAPAAVVTSVKPQEYSFPDFPDDREPMPWE